MSIELEDIYYNDWKSINNERYAIIVGIYMCK